jgi:outer membrane protein TolC
VPIANAQAPQPASQLPYAQKPQGPGLWRSYKGATVAPVYSNNAQRIYNLIRGGNLYLTVEDALALAIENNLNLEIARYALPIADWAVERAQAGGPIRGVSNGSSNVGAVNSGTGVLGAIAAAGLSSNNNGSNNSSSQTVQQIGPVVTNFDPSLTGSNTFSHLTYPFANLAISGVNPLVDVNTISNTQLQQGLAAGGSVRIINYYYRQKENAPGDFINPAIAPYVRLSFQQPLLQSFGIKVNSRSIRSAENSLNSAREDFRGQMIALVANVLNLYWNLVSARDELKMRQHALEASEKFEQDTRTEIGLGALPRVQLTKSEAEVASRRQDTILAEASVRQQETLLKNQLVRREDPVIEGARVVPLDAILTPAEGDMRSLREMVATAMAKRPDVATAKIADENAAINAVGTQNGLLPNLIAFGDLRDRAASGPAATAGANPYFTGGYGSALGQIFRHNFPSEYAGIALSGMPLNNRQAQADYGIEQLQLKVSQLSEQRDANNIAVAVSNQMIALQQAGAKYSTAVNTRKLQEQVLADDQKKFTFGTATIATLITDQRALVTAQLAEEAALAAYAHARVSLDQVLGVILETNHISFEEGVTGRIARESRPPAFTPQANPPAAAGRAVNGPAQLK